METGSWRAVTPAGEAFVAAVAADPAGTLLAMDFDGTLAPVVPNPLDSRLHDGSATALSTLVPRLGAVAIVTGRPVDLVRDLARLDARPELAGLGILGQYGAERYDPRTGQVRRPEAPAAVEDATADLRALLDRLADEGHDTSGVFLEDKGLAVGVHTRRAAEPEEILRLLAIPVAEIADRYGLHVEPGRLVFELRALRSDKGDALHELVADHEPRLVAMLGDDLGDLPAFNALEDLRAQGLVCCAVVSHSAEQPAVADRADVLCDGPDGIADWLTALAAAVAPSGRPDQIRN